MSTKPNLGKHWLSYVGFSRKSSAMRLLALELLDLEMQSLSVDVYRLVWEGNYPEDLSTPALATLRHSLHMGCPSTQHLAFALDIDMKIIASFLEENGYKQEEQ